MVDRTEQEAQELEQLKENSPYRLPDNAAESGWTTDQIKEKFYAGLFYLYKLFKALRKSNDDFTEDMSADFAELETKVQAVLDNLTAEYDIDGNKIVETYAKIAAIMDGSLPALKYIKANGSSENIRQIADDLVTFSTLINSYFDGAGKALNAILADKATNDANGRNIVATYATITALQTLTNSVNALLNGTSVANKALNDSDGNSIKNTYVKKSQIVDNVTSTSTVAPLSANQGKYLKGLIDALSDYIYSGAANTSIDRLAEVFAFLTGHDDDETLDGILAGKVSIANIIDNLESEVANKPLSAKQGYVLDQKVALKVAIADIIDNLTTENSSKPLSAKQGYVLKGLIDSLTSTKADADDVYTKQGTEDKINSMIADIEGVNVINDIPNNKNYDYQILLRADNEIVLRLTEVE